MADTLKVSLLLPSRGYGGGARAIMCFANGMQQRGHDVRILIRAHHRTPGQKFRENVLVKLYGSHDWLENARVPVLEYDSLRDFTFTPEETVVAMCTQTSFDLAELDRGSCVPVYHCHGAEIENWDNMIRAWHLPTFKIAVCSRLCRSITAETGQKCFGVVPDGVSLAEYHPVRTAAPPDAVGAGFRWRYSKDPANIIRIFSEVKKRKPRTPLVSFSTGRKPAGFSGVSFTRYPSVEKARELYARSRVWFLPSIEEGFGLPVLEAMACGCTVVATDSGGPGDIIRSGENGFLADVGNYGEMTRRIVQLLEDDDLYDRIRKAGLETASRYSWESAAQTMETKLREILAAADNPGTP